MKSFFVVNICLLLAFCNYSDGTELRDLDPEHIHTVLDDWHQAASDAYKVIIITKIVKSDI